MIFILISDMNITTGPIAEAYGAGDATFGYPAGMSQFDLVPEHMMHLVHDHWKQFPPVNPMWHYLLGVIYIIIGIFSFLGKYFCLRFNVHLYAKDDLYHA